MTRHCECPGGCGQLSDECACARKLPLGAIRIEGCADVCLWCDGHGEVNVNGVDFYCGRCGGMGFVLTAVTP